MNAKAMKLVKSWLGFTRSAIAAIIPHPIALDIPSIPKLTTKAKLAYLTTVHLLPNLLIKEIAFISLSNLFVRLIEIPLEAKSIIKMAVDSVNSIDRKTLPKATRAVYKRLTGKVLVITPQLTFGFRGNLETFTPWKTKIGYEPGLWTVFQLDNCPSSFVQHRIYLLP